MNRTITSVQLTAGGGAVVNYTIQGDDSGAVVVYDSAQLVHSDMLQAFEELRPLVAQILGFPETMIALMDEPAPLGNPILRVNGVALVKDYAIFKAIVVAGKAPYKVTAPKFQTTPEALELIGGVFNEGLQYLDGKGAQLSLFGDKTAEDIIAEAEADKE